MKLLRFQIVPGDRPSFGVAVGDTAVPFGALMKAFNEPYEGLVDSAAYLRCWPESLDRAQRLYRWAHSEDSRRPLDQYYPLQAIALLSPLEPTALYDFALAPAHLLRSARTLLHHELPRPLNRLAGSLASLRYSKPPRPEDLRFYVGSPGCWSGPFDTVPWPEFSAYLDIEPEVAAVTASIEFGATSDAIATRIAGYCIFNDLSARDVQFPEMSTGTLGFMRAKHFRGSNGFGPYLVTPDEVGDPRDLDVRINIGDRLLWEGSTQEYQFGPEIAIGRLSQAFALTAGSVVGMGTVPGCCGLDNDDWARPGERVTIEIERLGTLVQTLGVPQAIRNRRWSHRAEMADYYASESIGMKRHRVKPVASSGEAL